MPLQVQRCFCRQCAGRGLGAPAIHTAPPSQHARDVAALLRSNSRVIMQGHRSRRRGQVPTHSQDEEAPRVCSCSRQAVNMDNLRGGAAGPLLLPPAPAAARRHLLVPLLLLVMGVHLCQRLRRRPAAVQPGNGGQDLQEAPGTQGTTT